jgi:hypothetical protein
MQTSLGYNMYFSHQLWGADENHIQLATVTPYTHFKTLWNRPIINGTIPTVEVTTKLTTCVVHS